MASLLEDIHNTITPTPTLWWLGGYGFIVRFATITFYVDPFLPEGGPIKPGEIKNADMILLTDAERLHAGTLLPMLDRSKGAKVLMPKSACGAAHAAGIPYERMTTTDADLRVEYFKDNLYGRVYAVPSARPQLDRTPLGGHPHLGYLIRFGRWTVYHGGSGTWYPELADRLRPFNVNVALLPVGGEDFSVAEAASLAADIGAGWVAPMGAADCGEAFIAHLLGHRPAQAFKVFEKGEKWTVPEE